MSCYIFSRDIVRLEIESFHVLHKGPVFPTKRERALWTDLESGAARDMVRNRLAQRSDGSGDLPPQVLERLGRGALVSSL